MKPRLFLLWLFRALFFHADSERSPTRAVEYLLAWCITCWSATIFLFAGTMDGPSYLYIREVAAESVWGAFGIGFGVLRISALIINGAWRRTPLLRFVGAMSGFMWWITIGGLFYLGVKSGAQPFPMLGCYPVLAFFEGYSCFRCGQDAKAMRSLSFAPRGPVAHRGARHG